MTGIRRNIRKNVTCAFFTPKGPGYTARHITTKLKIKTRANTANRSKVVLHFFKESNS